MIQGSTVACPRHDPGEVTLHQAVPTTDVIGLKERLLYAKEGFTKHEACEMTPELPRRTEEKEINCVSKGVGMGVCLWLSHRPLVFET